MFLKTPEQPKALGYMEAGCSPFHCRLYVYSKKVNFFAWLFMFLGPWAALPGWLDTQYRSGNPLLVCHLLVLHLICLGCRRGHSLFFCGSPWWVDPLKQYKKQRGLFWLVHHRCAWWSWLLLMDALSCEDEGERWKAERDGWELFNESV